MAERTENWKETEQADPSEPRDVNPDPITGAPGSHPVGTGVGAAVGGVAAGLAGGAIAGIASGAALGAALTGPAAPIGGVIGAVIGGLVGGMAGKGVAESANPTAEEAYWRENFRDRPYYEPGKDYEDYRPAYEYGWESRGQFAGKHFDDVEQELRKGWEGRGNKGMTWDTARGATRDAWDRMAGPAGTAAVTDVTPASPSANIGTTDTSSPDAHTPRVRMYSQPAAGAEQMASAQTVGEAGDAPVACNPGVRDTVAGPTGFDADYWQRNFAAQSYATPDARYEDFAPAYRYGHESRSRYPTRQFEDVEPDLRSGWERTQFGANAGWDKVKHAVRDAWHGVERRLPGDADRDGR